MVQTLLDKRMKNTCSKSRIKSMASLAIYSYYVCIKNVQLTIQNVFIFSSIQSISLHFLFNNSRKVFLKKIQIVT